MRRIVSVVRISLAVSLSIVYLARVSIASEPAPNSRDRSDLYPLLPLAEGRWQVFAVPRPWLRTHWQGPAITALYFELSSATPKDIEDDVGPCVAPARLVAVLTREGHAPTEIPLEYYDFCSPRRAQIHADWPSGAQVYVDGIAVRLAPDGHVEIEQAFRRHLEEPYPADKSPATFPRPATGTAVKSVRIVPLDELYRVLK
ncbi:MAG: hypothetical protein JWO52_6462 [Gammaproteobacteria bacterium]|jgi:hypothetical protein|nr:hypothetical protein [Gammaproteobacteria bacterium]